MKSPKMNSSTISVISLQDIISFKEKEEVNNQDKKSTLKILFSALGISIFGIIGCCTLFCIPWTIIPRTNSIIYQSYWMEIVLPVATTHVVTATLQICNLTTWLKVEDMMSISNWLKMYFLRMI